MKWIGHTGWTRNRFLRVMLLAPATYVLAACNGKQDKSEAPEPAAQAPATGASSSPAAAATSAEAARTASPATQAAPASSPGAQALAPTPECGDDDDQPTVAQTEGPYFTPGSPERISLLEPGMRGTPLVVTGTVLTTACRPVTRALVDFWQCDDAGVYDNRGFRLRGHQFTDAAGRYRLETILPGVYPGRTRHIHVKVQAPNQRVLTTQLYFPDEPGNARDGIFRRELVMDVQDSGNGKAASFDFVLNIT